MIEFLSFVGAYLYEIQTKELEESFTSIESESPSRIKHMTASLKRLKLPRSNFSRISQIFQRNRTSPSHNLNNTLPEQRDSVTQPIISPQSNEGKFKIPDFLQILFNNQIFFHKY